MSTLDESTLNLLKMTKAYIEMGDTNSAHKCIDRALSTIEPPKFCDVRVTNGFQDPTSSAAR